MNLPYNPKKSYDENPPVWHPREKIIRIEPQSELDRKARAAALPPTPPPPKPGLWQDHKFWKFFTTGRW